MRVDNGCCTFVVTQQLWCHMSIFNHTFMNNYHIDTFFIRIYDLFCVESQCQRRLSSALPDNSKHETSSTTETR